MRHAQNLPSHHIIKGAIQSIPLRDFFRLYPDSSPDCPNLKHRATFSDYILVVPSSIFFVSRACGKSDPKELRDSLPTRNLGRCSWRGSCEFGRSHGCGYFLSWCDSYYRWRPRRDLHAGNRSERTGPRRTAFTSGLEWNASAPNLGMSSVERSTGKGASSNFGVLDDLGTFSRDKWHGAESSGFLSRGAVPLDCRPPRADFLALSAFRGPPLRGDNGRLARVLGCCIPFACITATVLYGIYKIFIS